MADLYTSLDAIPLLHADLRKVFYSGKTQSVQWRKDQLRHLAYLVKENEYHLSEAIRQDLGRTHNETCIMELTGLMNEILEAVESIESWAKPEHVKPELALRFLTTIIYKEPKGPALIIGTWNYPVVLSLSPLVGAIAAGCPAVLKLSEVTPNVSSLLAKLIPQYLDTSAYAVALGEANVTTKLLDESWGHIFYTGNSKIARIVAIAAAKTLTTTTLELGGKSPVIIDPDLRDFSVVAKRLLWAKRANAGQTCIAPDFVMVTKSREADLLQAIKKEHARAFPASSRIKKGDIAKIVNGNHYKRLNGALSRSQGKIEAGGNKAEQDEVLDVTVVTHVSWDDELMKDEIFGPILPVVAVDTISEGLQQLQDKTPLSIIVFSQNKAFVDMVRQKTRSGALLQNDLMLHHNVSVLPFGGVGESGQGSYHGKKSFDAFTHERSFLKNPFWTELVLAVRYFPHTDQKVAMFRKMGRSIDFARPGRPTSFFGLGGIGRTLAKYALFALTLAAGVRQFGWIFDFITSYRLVRVR